MNNMAIIVFLFGLIAGYFLNLTIKIVSAAVSNEDSKKKILSFKNIKGGINYIEILIKENLFLRFKTIDFLVVIITALLFSAAFYRFGLSTAFTKAAVMSSILIVASFVDLRHQIIPDTLVIITLISAIVLLAAGGMSISSAVLGMLLGGGILFILALVPGALGGGDIKLMFALGGFMGPGKTLWAILIAFIAASCISVLLLIFKIVGRKDHIPFGPFLALGCIVSFLLL